MSTPSPRQTRRAKRLRSIKDAALELVAEDGIEGFSVHKLAERVDLTAGALYRYFDSRDEMLIAVQAEVIAVFDLYLLRVLAEYRDAAVLEQIIAMCRAYVALADLQPEKFRLNAQFVAAPQPIFKADAVASIAHATLEMLGRLATLLELAAEGDELREGSAQRRAVLAWSSIDSLVARRKLERLAPEAFGSAGLLDELLLTLLVGWGASLEAAQTAVAIEVPMDMLRAAIEAAVQEQERGAKDV